MKASDEEQLLQFVCDILVKDAGFQLVWFGYPALDENGIRVVAKSGNRDRLMEAPRPLWELPEFLETAKFVLRNGQPCWIENLRSETTTSSVLALPLVSGGEMFGVLTVYAATGEIRSDSVDVLREWAGVFANELSVLRARKQRQTLDAALREREKELRHFVDVVPQHIFVLGPDGRLLYANQVALEYHGFKLEDIQSPDATSKIIHPSDVHHFWTEYHAAFSNGVPLEMEIRLLGKDGAYRWFIIRVNPLKDEHGRIIRWYGTRTDIEDRKRTEDELRRSEAYLAEAQRLSHAGTWVVDPVSRRSLYWSGELFRIWGFEPSNTPPPLEALKQRIHPDDAEKLYNAREQTLRDKRNYSVDYRIVLPDGSVRHIHSVGRPVVNSDGMVEELVGTSIDVTQQYEASAALQQAFDEIKELKDQLYKENLSLKEEMERSAMSDEIVGTSESVQNVLARVSKVAPTDSTVLIMGETGTGKERIARAIHKQSRRRAGPFVHVNCAAIPQALIGSELFGHEKGAFTGALQRRLGRFELAEGGTIFLDEIGELPAETQVALLRVLQEREFERLGGNESISANARVIAATNRNLQAAIGAGTFRNDLFYRLNVFPIELPPLRDRREDIPQLVEYFIDRHARQVGKKFGPVSKKTLELLQSYPWPGNIRELQNVIERSVIVCDEGTFSIDESWLSGESDNSKWELVETEQSRISTALARANGNRTLAARMLGISRATLYRRLSNGAGN